MAAEDIPEADHSEGAPAADSAEAEVLAPVVRDLAVLAEGGAGR